MRRSLLSSLAAAATILAGCGTETTLAPSREVGEATRTRAEPRAALEWDFTEIHVPGARSTFAFGINPAGHVVGSYVDNATPAREHGFVLRDGVFSTIDFPGARYTVARGINPRGDIVGDYALPGEPPVNSHGFLLTAEGSFVRVDAPPHTSTIAQRILPNGAILGCRHDSDRMSTMRGILIDRAGGIEELDEFGSMHNGATPDRRLVVGLYMNMMVPGGRTEGYVVDDGDFEPFVFPGSDATQAWDINPRGEIVGFYRTGTAFRGFMRRGDEYFSIAYPGATATRAFGVNPQGDVVGWHTTTVPTGGTVSRAFLATSRGNRGGAE